MAARAGGGRVIARYEPSTTTGQLGNSEGCTIIVWAGNATGSAWPSTRWDSWQNWTSDTLRAYYTSVKPPSSWAWYNGFRLSMPIVVELPTYGRGAAYARFYRGLRDTRQVRRHKRKAWIQKARTV